MLAELKKGDDVSTQGGIIGKITGIKDNEVTLQVQEGVRVRFLRSAITGLYTGATRPAEKSRDEVRKRRRPPNARTPADVQHTHGKILVVEGGPLRFRHRGGRALPDSDGRSGGEAAEFIQKHFQKRIQLGLDLQGGLHLVYEVNVDKAVSDKVDRLASDIEDRLRKDKGVTDVASIGARRGTTTSSSRSRTRRTQAKVDDAVPARLPQVARPGRAATPRPASCGCASTPTRSTRCATTRSARASRPSATASTSSASPSRRSSRRGPTSSSSSPASSPPTSSAIKRIIGRTAQLEFKIVDDGSEYMKKVARRSRDAKAPSTAGIDVAARGVDREGLRQAARGRLPARRRAARRCRSSSPALTGELAVPPDHEIGYEEMPGARTRTASRRPTSYWRTYYLHKRAALTGEYLPNADQTWDQQTGRPEVSYEFDRQGAGDLRAADRRQHRPQDGHHPRRQDQQRAGHREPHRRRAAASRWAASAIRSRCSRRRRTWSRCSARARCPRRCTRPSRPRSARRMGRDAVEQGQVLDVHRRRRRHPLHADLLPAVRAHRERRDDPEHAVHARDPGGASRRR